MELDHKLCQLDCPKCGQRSHHVTLFEVEDLDSDASACGLCPKCGCNFELMWCTLNGDRNEK